MKKIEISFLGTTLNPNTEHEIFSENKFGFLVTVFYNRDCWYSNKRETFHNVTEVHYLYNYKDIAYGGRVAFESDIQHRGITRPLSFIKKIKIDLAKKRYENF
jgi:hypothetical protein